MGLFWIHPIHLDSPGFARLPALKTEIEKSRRVGDVIIGVPGRRKAYEVDVNKRAEMRRYF